MNTGIKALDTVIQRWGISAEEVSNAFQTSTHLTGRDPRALRMGLPHCIIQEIGRHKHAENLSLHQFYLPHRKAKLACFVTDMQGKVLERVYYGHERKYWRASEKVADALTQMESGKQTLAA